MTVEQLLLGKHIEPSGQHIHQHTQNASQQHKQAHPPRYHAAVTVARWGGESDGEAFAKQIWTGLPSIWQSKCFYAWFGWFLRAYPPALIDRPRAANDIIIIHAL